MEDFVERLIRNNPEKYGRDGIHVFQNNKMMIVFTKKGAEFEIMEFKRF